MKEEEAVTTLAPANLKTEIVARKYDEKVREGLVLIGGPEPGPACEGGAHGSADHLGGITLGNRSERAADVAGPRPGLCSKRPADAGERGRRATTIRFPPGTSSRRLPIRGRRWFAIPTVNLEVSRGPETPTEDVTNGDKTNTGPRTYDVEFLIPPGPTLQDVRIVVIGWHGRARGLSQEPSGGGDRAPARDGSGATGDGADLRERESVRAARFLGEEARSRGGEKAKRPEVVGGRR